MTNSLQKIKPRPDFALEDQYSGNVVGIDEAGCGPWAGPVVAGACIFMQREGLFSVLDLINDSKTLSEKKREHIFDQLLQLSPNQFCYSVGMASVLEIDQLNIGQAARLAMQRAVNNLPINASMALVDGIRKPALNQEVMTVIRGDQKSYSIAAASIIAKVTRDRLMKKLAQEFPVYGWDHNAGYGTAKHQAALAEFGVTVHHRRSFAPIKKLISSSDLQNYGLNHDAGTHLPAPLE